MTPNEIAERLNEIDSMAASVVLDAESEAKKYTPQCLLTDVVVMLLATHIADQRRKLIGIQADAEGRIAAIVEANETQFSQKKCPKCGASTLVNGQDEWCSFIGGQDEKPCDWVKP